MTAAAIARWEAAVALQYEVAPAIAALEGQASYELIDNARQVLRTAYEELPTEVRETDTMDARWRAAYIVVQKAERRAQSRGEVAARRLGMCAVLQRIPELSR